MNINEGLKEVAVLKGKLLEVHAKINRQKVIKEYVSQDLNLPIIKLPAPVDPLINEYLGLLEDIEALKLKITTANLKSGALTLIHRVNYLKASLSLLKPLTEIEEESLDMSTSYMAKTATLIKTSVNYNFNAAKDLFVKIELDLRETLVALDKINYSTEI